MTKAPLPVFISFQTTDSGSRDNLVEALSARGLDFTDCSMREETDDTWKTEARQRINTSIGTVVLIGETTHLSDPVAWEIAETRRARKPILGVRLEGIAPTAVEDLIDLDAAIPWDIHEVEHWLRKWSAR